jgi:hypothetical protein
LRFSIYSAEFDVENLLLLVVASSRGLHPPALLHQLRPILGQVELTTSSNSGFFSSTLWTCITSNSPPARLNIDLVVLVAPCDETEGAESSRLGSWTMILAFWQTKSAHQLVSSVTTGS